ncbi:MAG TPA: helix-turn-helix domain-containing protein [Marmoricola sp.]|nr:helix-turn-helix domain-containing protein [Marmoricola sp.]
MPPRATAMSADERRTAIIDATLPLLLEHGRTVTTRQIAEAAGVAEGTIFRVFESKDDLVLAAVEHGMDMEPFLADLAAVDPTQDLRGRLLDIVARLQIRFTGIFELMTAMGMVGPPRAHRHMEEGRRRAEEIMVGLVEPDADRLTVRPDQLVHLLRLLTFSGTHPHISDGRRLTPEQVVGVLLDGVLRRDS